MTSEGSSSRNRRVRRNLLIILCLEVLVYGGYIGQVWWAKCVARRWLQEDEQYLAREVRSRGRGDILRARLRRWRSAPWYGEFLLEPWRQNEFWVPRRAYYEFFRPMLDSDASKREVWFQAQFWDIDEKSGRIMGESWFHVFSRLYSGDDLCRVFKEVTQAPLPDDLDSWRSWFDTHPDLVWDEQRKHLVESLPKDTVPK